MSNNNLLTEMGRRIYQRRKEMFLSQEELAEKADVSPQMISTAERGVKGLRNENLIKISEALGISTDYLLKGTINENDEIPLAAKLKQLSPEDYRIVEKIIDQCIALCERKNKEPKGL